MSSLLKNSKKWRILSLVLALVIGIIIPCDVVYAKSPRKFTKSQQRNADRIAEVCIKEWETYGVLPSIAIAQAFIESTLGDHCRGYNLWGIRSGAVTYSSLENGIYGYLKVINNGYYPNAPFQTDYKAQIRKILDGGYCQPEGAYYSKALWTVREYNLTKYDTELFKVLEANKKKKEEETKKRKRKKLEKETEEVREFMMERALRRADTEYTGKRYKKQYKQCYEFVYDPTVPKGKVSVDISMIYGGKVIVYSGLTLVGEYGAVNGKIDGYYLGTRDKSLVGKVVYIDIHEDEKG